MSKPNTAPWLTEIDPDLFKYALRWLAASVDTTDEGMSDAAADYYREQYGEDYGNETFSRAALSDRIPKGDQ